MGHTRSKYGTLDRQMESMNAAKDEEPICPPVGCDLTDREMEVWRYFVGIRLAEDWRQYDLMLLARACRLEIMIRDATDQLEDEGFLMETKRGTVSNPIITVLQRLNIQQLSILRHIGMVSPEDVSKNDKGDKVNKDRKALGKRIELAVPVHYWR